MLNFPSESISSNSGCKNLKDQRCNQRLVVLQLTGQSNTFPTRKARRIICFDELSWCEAKTKAGTNVFSLHHSTQVTVLLKIPIHKKKHKGEPLGEAGLNIHVKRKTMSGGRWSSDRWTLSVISKLMMTKWSAIEIKLSKKRRFSNCLIPGMLHVFETLNLLCRDNH